MARVSRSRSAIRRAVICSVGINGSVASEHRTTAMYTWISNGNNAQTRKGGLGWPAEISVLSPMFSLFLQLRSSF
jgi:hypothetical protein